MENSQDKTGNKLFYIGLALIVFELVILFFSGLNRSQSGDFFSGSGIFLINYIIAILYYIFVLIEHKTVFRLKRIKVNFFIITLTLLSISAFSLNNSIPVFSQFSSWVLIYLNLFYAAYISICFLDKLPGFIKVVIYFILGMGIVIIAYFAAYLAPLYFIAIFGAILLGLSLHLFVPLLVLISLLIIFWKLEKTKIEKFAFVCGIILPLLMLSVFLVKWNNFKTEIHNASASIITRPENTLPEWVLFCQNIPSDNFSQRIIEGNLVYDTFYNLWGGWSKTAFDEVKIHDPLVNIGMALLGDINLDTDTRIKILKSQYNARHVSQRKLWSGRDLETIDVLNDIKVFPDYRFAYTEKIITVKNSNKWQEDKQEAAFTFYLPEGSVATSLSLWINGKEEKSRLTTKSKADSAYTTIVGVEQHDPALLHWQEGNTLTVTLFPCSPKENRKFKIGITTPLEKTNKQLKLSNVYFDGPLCKNILETTSITFISDHKIENIDLPEGFKKNLNNNYTYSGVFRPYWEMKLTTTPLSSQTFSFNNYSYQLRELNKQSTHLDLKTLYLDINSSWTKHDFDEIIMHQPKLKIYAFHDKMIEINEGNKDHIFEILNKMRFSLFPFHKIKHAENAIVISKSSELSPNLSDLEGSIFLNELINKISNDSVRINFFELGDNTSPYIKTLKEFNLFNFEKGSLLKLNQFINNQEFIKSNQLTNQTDIDIANISIFRDTLNKTGKAPDHLMRLFAYNNLMKNIGRNYFNKDSYYLKNTVTIANEAYIVSPVSSLIVLETVKDYERFGIEENQNSLKNASMKSSGAVPEPSEWALIILFICLLIFLYFRNRFFSKTGWLKNS
ncbi:MAG: XrtN system VIT domain-containing protein [Bacteroidales bacterium]